MNTLYVHGSVVWATVALFVYWGFFTYSAQTLTAFLWILTAVLVRRTLVSVLVTLEWLCGAGAHSSSESSDQTHGPVIEGHFLGALVRLLALTVFAGPKATAEWRDGIITTVALGCCATHVERHAAGWAHWPNWRFRAVALLSAFAALSCALLQWSFFATIPQPHDEQSEMVHYTLIVWVMMVSIRLLQSLTFELLHILSTTRCMGGDASEFDPMEEVGLTVRTISSAVGFILALRYCPRRTTALIHLTVVYRFYETVDAVLQLHHFNAVLRAFPEVQLTGYCVICLEPITRCNRARKLHCGHVFHTRCLRRWLMRADHCPMCRHPSHQRYDGPISLFGFGVERQDVQERWLHHSQAVTVQTTLNRINGEFPSSFHGSLHPLIRPMSAVGASSVVYADVISNTSSSSNSSSGGSNSSGSNSSGNINPRSTYNRGQESLLMLLPVQLQQPSLVTQSALAVSPIEVESTSEFTDKPIAQQPVAECVRRNSRRKRRQSVVLQEPNDSVTTGTATTTTTTTTASTSTVEGGGTGTDRAPCKRLKLEETES